jgi:uncharacterized protein
VTPSNQFVPSYSVAINGTQIPTTLNSSITSIIYESGLDAADRVELVLANPGLEWLQNHINGLGFVPIPTPPMIPRGAFTPPSGLFDMDNTITVSLGYADRQLTEVFDGEITAARCPR